MADRKVYVRLDKKERDEIRAKYAAGVKTIILAMEYGVSESTAYKIAYRRSNMDALVPVAPKKRVRLGQEARDEIRAKVAAGTQYAILARKFGVSRAYVHQIVYRTAKYDQV